MLGRSDGTLNPNGVRFGSAEIYNIVEGGRLRCRERGVTAKSVEVERRMSSQNVEVEDMIRRC